MRPTAGRSVAPSAHRAGPTATTGAAGHGTDLAALAEHWVGRARPGEQIEVVVGRSTTTNVRAYEGEVESFTSATSFGVGIRVVEGGRQGFAHAGTFDDEVVADTLADARDNARFAEADPWAGLAEPDGVAAVAQDLWRPEVVATPAERKIALALELERAVVQRDSRVRGVRLCTYGDSAGEVALASTAGIRSAGRSTSCWVSVSALASDGGETQVGYGVDAGRDPERLDLDRVAVEAVTEATRLLGARQARSQRVALLLDARQAATVLGIVAGTLTGDTVLKGRSPFAERRGERIASPLLTLLDDATNPASLAADTYDGEGLACRRTTLVDGGVLTGFLHDSYTGRRSGSGSTGSAVRSSRTLPGVGVQAMAVAPGRHSWEDLLASAQVALCVQAMHGLHSGVNPTSGDFSVGIEGLMVRGGELAEPVREVTVASTLQRLLQDVVAVGATVEWLPSGTGCPPLLIGEVALSGA